MREQTTRDCSIQPDGLTWSYRTVLNQCYRTCPSHFLWRPDALFVAARWPRRHAVSICASSLRLPSRRWGRRISYLKALTPQVALKQ